MYPYKTGDKVRVIKPFYALRDPCPPAGTIGTITREWDEQGFIGVNFPLPMLDTEGNEWIEIGSDPPEWGIDLKFRDDEIELAETS